MKHGFTARLLAAAFGVAIFATGASAQTSWPSPGGAEANGQVQMCLNSSGNAVPVSSNACANPMQVSGTFTASLGGFTPSASGARGTPLTVTTSDTSGPLPTGAVDVVSNAGTTNPMYCNVNGVAATASDQYIAPSGGWFAFTIPSGVTTLHCIATGGSTTANMVGGSGLPTGTGGGSGGGGGGSSAITTWAGGTLGAMANYGTSPGAVLVPGMNAFVTNTVAVTGTFWPYTLGQQLAASSVPVVLTAAQLSTLTPPTTVTVTQSTSSNLKGQFDPLTIATWGLMAGTTPGTAPTNTAVIGGIYNSSAPTATTGQTLPLQTTAAGSLHTTVDNTNGNGRATSANSSPVVPSAAPTTWHLIAAASTNATSVKGSAATLLACQLGGVGSTPAFLKIYNKASAPTVGTDTPVLTLIIPAASTAANGAGSNISFGPGGLSLGTGFAAAITGVITDADTTNVAASTFAVSCQYE